jgi:hypothetical protein
MILAHLLYFIYLLENNMTYGKSVLYIKCATSIWNILNPDKYLAEDAHKLTLIFK